MNFLSQTLPKDTYLSFLVRTLTIPVDIVIPWWGGWRTNNVLPIRNLNSQPRLDIYLTPIWCRLWLIMHLTLETVVQRWHPIHRHLYQTLM